MKTSQSSKSELKSAIAGLSLIIIATLFITSCQKEELQQPASGSNATEASRLIDHVLPMPLFYSIKIDHIAARSLLADYSITLNADGTATYEGRRNVHIRGVVKFNVTESALAYINSVCQEVNFFDLKGGYTYIPDMPSVATTYSKDPKYSKTLNDYDGDPAALVVFRSKIENALALSKLIIGDKRFQNVVNAK